MPAPSLQDLREARGLPQSAIGVHQVMASRYENGHERPSPASLQKIAAALTAAHPAEPISVPQVVAACRESQRRAMVARARSARLVGKAHRRLSCPQRTPAAVRKAGRS